MWHILEAFGRRVARKVDSRWGQRLLDGVGGELKKDHTPREYGPILGDKFEGEVIGYVSNRQPIYSHALIEVEADGIPVCKVTRKQDAFRIMQALKRDYKNVVVRIK